MRLRDIHFSLLRPRQIGSYPNLGFFFYSVTYLGTKADEFTQSKLTDAERFASVMKQVVGRRLTYNELIGKTESGVEMYP